MDVATGSVWEYHGDRKTVGGGGAVVVTGEESEGCEDRKGVGWMWRQEGGRMDVATGSEWEYHGYRK